MTTDRLASRDVDGSTASPTTIDHLAEVVFQVRPSWDRDLIRVVLLNMRDQVHTGDLAVAAIKAAQNMDLPTPKAITWRGHHWDDLLTKPATAEPRERCSVCGKTEPRCYGERPGRDDDHRFTPRPAP